MVIQIAVRYLFEKKGHEIAASTVRAGVGFCLNRVPTAPAFDSDAGSTGGTIAGRDPDSRLARWTIYCRG